MFALTGCSAQGDTTSISDSSNTAPAARTSDGVDRTEIIERYADAGITNVDNVDIESFTGFFKQQASRLDTLRYVAQYSIGTSTEVTVDRRPDKMTATINDDGVEVTLRISAEAALLCDSDGCIGFGDWLADPYKVDPPARNGRSVAQWWDIFTETGAHDPTTVLYIPTAAKNIEDRLYHLGTRELSGIGTLRCAGYTTPTDTRVASWCFTDDGVWASGPLQRATLVSITLP